MILKLQLYSWTYTLEGLLGVALGCDLGQGIGSLLKSLDGGRKLFLSTQATSSL